MPFDTNLNWQTGQNVGSIEIAQRQYVYRHWCNFDCHEIKLNQFRQMLAMHHTHYPLAKTKSLFININTTIIPHCIKNQFKLIRFLPGSSQSPAGNFALISTFPYLNANESCVRSFALRTGLISIGMEPVRSQPKNDGFVHLIRSKLKIKLSKMITFCNVKKNK